MSALTLRDLKAEDGALLRHWRNSSEVSEYMYTRGTISEEDHARWFSAIQRDRSRKYWIVELDEVPIGLLNLCDIDEKNRTANWGFYLASEAVRGRGVGSYCEFWIQRYVFETLGFNKIWGEILSDNHRMLHNHEKFGFRREGLFRSHVLIDGKYSDVVRIGLLADEWRVMKDQLIKIVEEKGFAI